MGEKVLLGRGKQITEISSEAWEKHLEQAREHNQERPDFMTEAHQQVRYFVVSELMSGKPLSPEFISKIGDAARSSDDVLMSGGALYLVRWGKSPGHTGNGGTTSRLNFVQGKTVWRLSV
jgi:hypothetical protein